jgi:serine O-acetyltransferase
MTETPGGGDNPIQFASLGRIVGELRSLRTSSHHTRYGGAPLPELPSKIATVAAVDDLVGALFPRHFGPHDLAGDGFDAFVTAALTSALESLRRQVRRELELAAPEAEAASGDFANLSHDIVRRLADDLPNIRALLESDIRAAYEGDPAAGSLDEVICCYPGVTAIIRHRLAHGLYRLGAPMLARIISEAAHAITGIDIHPGAEIGGSFFIDHGTGVVVGETAIIGQRVRLYQGVTLGARRFERDSEGGLAKNYPRHPIIEDDVVIYAGASVLGRITVGRGSTISGSVWLTKSVPPMTTVIQAQSRSDVFDDGGGI